MSTIIETTFNGVTTVLASRRGPTVRAGLTFRVGRADETLATAGITHLIEHLALHKHGIGDLHFNGTTDNCFTDFHVQGSEAEVVEYLNGVCAALSLLPLDRLETEKQILRTEGETRGPGPAPDMAVMRYGARGFGLASYPEFGLPNATAATVEAWAARWFTRENAVLWITSDRVPEGLVLDLPSGSRQPMPAVTSALPTTPAWFSGPNQLTFLEAVIPRSTAGRLFAGVLSKRLFRELRQEGGLCYTAQADYVPRDADSAVVWAVADADPDQREAVVGGFVDVLAALRFGEIALTDLEAVRSKTLRQFEEPDVAAHRLPGYAANLLSGHPNLSEEVLIAEIRATTIQDLQQIAEVVWSQALVQVPVLGLTWAGVEVAPQSSATEVAGSRTDSAENDGSAVIIGAEGMTLAHPAGRATVLFADTVAMLSWPDGARRLYGPDGFYIHLEPTIYPAKAAERALIDRGVRADMVVAMPRREPEAIPKPQRQRRTAPTWQSALLRGAGQVLAVVLGFLGIVSLVTAATYEVRAETRTDDIGTMATIAVIGGAFLIGSYRTFRASRRN